MSLSSSTLICICRKPYDGNEFVIECSMCDDWFHGRCIGLTPQQSHSVSEYFCPACFSRRSRAYSPSDSNDSELDLEAFFSSSAYSSSVRGGKGKGKEAGRTRRISCAGKSTSYPQQNHTSAHKAPRLNIASKAPNNPLLKHARPLVPANKTLFTHMSVAPTDEEDSSDPLSYLDGSSVYSSNSSSDDTSSEDKYSPFSSPTKGLSSTKGPWLGQAVYSTLLPSLNDDSDPNIEASANAPHSRSDLSPSSSKFFLKTSTSSRKLHLAPDIHPTHRKPMEAEMLATSDANSPHLRSILSPPNSNKSNKACTLGPAVSSTLLPSFSKDSNQRIGIPEPSDANTPHSRSILLLSNSKKSKVSASRKVHVAPNIRSTPRKTVEDTDIETEIESNNELRDSGDSDDLDDGVCVVCDTVCTCKPKTVRKRSSPPPPLPRVKHSSTPQISCVEPSVPSQPWRKTPGRCVQSPTSLELIDSKTIDSFDRGGNLHKSMPLSTTRSNHRKPLRQSQNVEQKEYLTTNGLKLDAIATLSDPSGTDESTESECNIDILLSLNLSKTSRSHLPSRMIHDWNLRVNNPPFSNFREPSIVEVQHKTTAVSRNQVTWDKTVKEKASDEADPKISQPRSEVLSLDANYFNPSSPSGTVDHQSNCQKPYPSFVQGIVAGSSSNTYREQPTSCPSYSGQHGSRPFSRVRKISLKDFGLGYLAPPHKRTRAAPLHHGIQDGFDTDTDSSMLFKLGEVDETSNGPLFNLFISP